jgi:hypothetical protein
VFARGVFFEARKERRRSFIENLMYIMKQADAWND